jgi:hypothetical protein
MDEGGGGVFCGEYQYQEFVVLNGGDTEDLERIQKKVIVS